MGEDRQYSNDRHYNSEISYPAIKPNNDYNSLPKAQSLPETNSLIDEDLGKYVANELKQIRRELHKIDVDNSRDREALWNVIKNCKIYIS